MQGFFVCVCVDSVKMLLSSRPINSQSSNQRASVHLRQRRLTSTSCHWRRSIFNPSRQTTSVSKRLGGIHTGNMQRIKQRQQNKTRPLICDGWLVCGIWPSHPLGSFPPDRDLLWKPPLCLFVGSSAQETTVTAWLKHTITDILTYFSITQAYLMTDISINRLEAV